MVAEHGDACNLIVAPDATPEDVRRKFDVLRAHCDELGRDEGTILRTILWPQPVDPRESAGFLARMEELAAVGVQEVHVMPFGDAGADPVAFVRALGEHVLPSLREL